MELVLTDGTKITCTLNGNNYITEQDVSKVDFSDKNFATITVDGEEMTNQHCTNVFKQDDGTHIIFRGLTADEILIADLKDQLESASANVAYVAMMTDVDIPVAESEVEE